MNIGLKGFDVSFIQIINNYRENINFLLTLFNKKDILHFEYFGVLYYTYDIKPMGYSNKIVFINYDILIEVIQEKNTTRSNKFLTQKELNIYTTSDFISFKQKLTSLANNNVIFYSEKYFNPSHTSDDLLIEYFDIYNINKINIILGFNNQFNKEILIKLKEYFNIKLRGLKIKKIGLDNN